MERVLRCLLAASVALSLVLAVGCETAAPKRQADGAGTKAASADAKQVFLCTSCGEIKGSSVCCKAEGRKKCASCGLFKGSPGCCKIPPGAKGPVQLCTKCGEIKGSPPCCKAEGRTKCASCGLFKGSPGCCKIK